MPDILIASLSPVGHIAPLLNFAQGLVDRGDRVTVLSSAVHAGKIRAVGATPQAIPAEADFDVNVTPGTTISFVEPFRWCRPGDDPIPRSLFPVPFSRNGPITSLSFSPSIRNASCP